MFFRSDARLALTNLSADNSIEYKNAFEGNGVFLVVINGSVEVDGTLLNKRDALGISETNQFEIKANVDAELLAIEIPM